MHESSFSHFHFPSFQCFLVFFFVPIVIFIPQNVDLQWLPVSPVTSYRRTGIISIFTPVLRKGMIGFIIERGVNKNTRRRSWEDLLSIVVLTLRRR